MSLPTGALLGAYEILALIGTGGMGEVYRARDSRLKRDVAIKVLPTAWAHDTDRLARFQREAELLATLNHPNIAAIYGVEEADGVKALILELVDGPTLADRLKQPLSFREAVPILRQIADALDAAHERGIVHRDLKPANIKVREDGAVKVLDFGLAKAIETEPLQQMEGSSPTLTSPAVTRAGVILGTAAYMSPEQARGQAIDRRTDIWAFGCILYEMVAGRAAFAAETVADTIGAILHREPDWSVIQPSTPTAVRSLLRRCLQKDRKHRFRDIGDVRHQLDELDVNDPPATVTSGRSARITALAGIAVVAAVGGATAFWALIRDRAPAPPSAPGVAVQLNRVTSDESFSTDPAVSRDGALVVYASDRAGNGQLDLWLQRTSRGQALRLTDDPADDRAPAFSPDGSLLAFRSDREGGGVYVMPALGGDARLVAPLGRAPRFSPDGSRIAYWTGSWIAGPRASGSAVFIVPATGGQPNRLADEFATANMPLWSPDGRSLLFFGRKSAATSPSEAFDWWWIPLNDGEPVATGVYPLLAKKGLDVVDIASESSGAAWTAKGLIFAARRGESINLWRVGVSERDGRVSETSLERLTSGTGSDLLPSAENSNRIVFQAANESAVSLTVPLESNTARVQGAIARQSYDAGDRENRNSLDQSGHRLAYVKKRQRESEIWLKDVTTGRERHVLTTQSFGINFGLSPDGTKIAYAQSENGVSVVYNMPATGGTPTKVCERCNFQGWFPDGRRIVSSDTAADGPGRRVAVIDTASGARSDLIVHPSIGIGRVDVSTDGRWLSFSSSTRILLAPVRPGNPPPESEWVTLLTKTANTGERPCGWSPDGRLLYLLLERDGFRDLYALRIDPARGVPVGEPFVVYHLHDPRRRWGSSPIGTAIVNNAFVFNQVEMTGSIWLLDMSDGIDAGRGPRP